MAESKFLHLGGPVFALQFKDYNTKAFAKNLKK
jgi:hypothetical protein